MTSQVKFKGSNITMSVTDGMGNSQLNEIKKYNNNIKQIIEGCTVVNNEPDYTSKDIINLRAFARIFDAQLNIVNKEKINIKKGSEIWMVEKTFQFKPFVRSNIYYRYRFKKPHNTIVNGTKIKYDVNDFTDFMIQRGEQLAFDNNVEKYYYKHPIYGNCYMGTNVLKNNGNITMYALTCTNIFTGKCINISHFISDITSYELEIERKRVLTNKQTLYSTENKIYYYFKRIIEKIKF